MGPREGDEMDYHVVDKKPVGGGIHKKTMPEMRPLNYISVEKVEEHIGIITKAGGIIVKELTEIPGMGRFAVALDPEGNPFGIFEADLNPKLD